MTVRVSFANSFFLFVVTSSLVCGAAKHEGNPVFNDFNQQIVDRSDIAATLQQSLEPQAAVPSGTARSLSDDEVAAGVIAQANEIPEKCESNKKPVATHCVEQLKTHPQWTTYRYITDLLKGLSPERPKGLPDPTSCFKKNAHQCLELHAQTVAGSLACSYESCIAVTLAASADRTCAENIKAWCPADFVKSVKDLERVSVLIDQPFQTRCSFTTLYACKDIDPPPSDTFTVGFLGVPLHFPDGCDDATRETTEASCWKEVKKRPQWTMYQYYSDLLNGLSPKRPEGVPNPAYYVPWKKNPHKWLQDHVRTVAGFLVCSYETCIVDTLAASENRTCAEKAKAWCPADFFKSIADVQTELAYVDPEFKANCSFTRRDACKDIDPPPRDISPVKFPGLAIHFPDGCDAKRKTTEASCWKELRTHPQWTTYQYITDLLKGLSPKRPKGLPDPTICFKNNAHQCLELHAQTVAASLACSVETCIAVTLAASADRPCANIKAWCPADFVKPVKDLERVSDLIDQPFQTQCSFTTLYACKDIDPPPSDTSTVGFLGVPLHFPNGCDDATRETTEASCWKELKKHPQWATYQYLTDLSKGLSPERPEDVPDHSQYVTYVKNKHQWIADHAQTVAGSLACSYESCIADTLAASANRTCAEKAKAWCPADFVNAMVDLKSMSFHVEKAYETQCNFTTRDVCKDIGPPPSDTSPVEFPGLAIHYPDGCDAKRRTTEASCWKELRTHPQWTTYQYITDLFKGLSPERPEGLPDLTSCFKEDAYQCLELHAQTVAASLACSVQTCIAVTLAASADRPCAENIKAWCPADFVKSVKDLERVSVLIDQPFKTQCSFTTLYACKDIDPPPSDTSVGFLGVPIHYPDGCDAKRKTTEASCWKEVKKHSQWATYQYLTDLSKGLSPERPDGVPDHSEYGTDVNNEHQWIVGRAQTVAGSLACFYELCIANTLVASADSTCAEKAKAWCPGDFLNKIQSLKEMSRRFVRAYETQCSFTIFYGCKDIGPPPSDTSPVEFPRLPIHFPDGCDAKRKTTEASCWKELRTHPQWIAYQYISDRLKGLSPEKPESLPDPAICFEDNAQRCLELHAQTVAGSLACSYESCIAVTLAASADRPCAENIKAWCPGDFVSSIRDLEETSNPFNTSFRTQCSFTTRDACTSPVEFPGLAIHYPDGCDGTRETTETSCWKELRTHPQWSTYQYITALLKGLSPERPEGLPDPAACSKEDAQQCLELHGRTVTASLACSYETCIADTLATSADRTCAEKAKAWCPADFFNSILDVQRVSDQVAGPFQTKCRFTTRPACRDIRPSPGDTSPVEFPGLAIHYPDGCDGTRETTEASCQRELRTHPQWSTYQYITALLKGLSPERPEGLPDPAACFKEDAQQCLELHGRTVTASLACSYETCIANTLATSADRTCAEKAKAWCPADFFNSMLDVQRVSDHVAGPFQTKCSFTTRPACMGIGPSPGDTSPVEFPGLAIHYPDGCDGTRETTEASCRRELRIHRQWRTYQYITALLKGLSPERPEGLPDPAACFKEDAQQCLELHGRTVTASLACSYETCIADTLATSADRTCAEKAKAWCPAHFFNSMLDVQRVSDHVAGPFQTKCSFTTRPACRGIGPSPSEAPHPGGLNQPHYYPGGCYTEESFVTTYCLKEMKKHPQWALSNYIADRLDGKSPERPEGLPDPAACFKNNPHECLKLHAQTVAASIACFVETCIANTLEKSKDANCAESAKAWCPSDLLKLTQSTKRLSDQVAAPFKTQCNFERRAACQGVGTWGLNGTSASPVLLGKAIPCYRCQTTLSGKMLMILFGAATLLV